MKKLSEIRKIFGSDYELNNPIRSQICTGKKLWPDLITMCQMKVQPCEIWIMKAKSLCEMANKCQFVTSNEIPQPRPCYPYCSGLWFTRVPPVPKATRGTLVSHTSSELQENYWVVAWLEHFAPVSHTSSELDQNYWVVAWLEHSAPVSHTSSELQGN